MRDRFSRIVFGVLVLLVAAYVAQPYLDRLLPSATGPQLVVPRGTLAESEQSTVELFERIAPSVVQVIVTPAWALRSPAAEGVDAGSGFVWDTAGHVVTNDHVVRDAAVVSVRLASGEVVPARVAGRAPNYDLAVLRLASREDLPAPISVGNSGDLKVGQAAFAIGNPFGLDQTLTTGIISALKRRLPTSSQREIADVIQTDAAINPGNSGGPLLDSGGRLIGVNTAIFSPSGASAGVGFAIPVDTVNRVVPELIRTGRVPTPGIGILVADEALTARLGVQGVLVAHVLPGSPAERAGLRGIDSTAGTTGDVIVEAGGHETRRLADLTDKLERVGVGDSIVLKVQRESRMFELNVGVVDVGDA